MMLKEPPPEAEVDEVDSFLALTKTTNTTVTPHDPETGEVL
jgi:hypothetical protein